MKEETHKDTELVANLFRTLKVCDSPLSITRLGNTASTSTRPIKIVMPNVKKKKHLMKALPKLKGSSAFSHLPITDDYTKKDRNTISSWLKEAKARNTENPGHLKT